MITKGNLTPKQKLEKDENDQWAREMEGWNRDRRIVTKQQENRIRLAR